MTSLYAPKEKGMKAVRMHAYGGPDVLAYDDVSQPVPAAGEVLVKVYAASFNPIENNTRAGYLQGMIQVEFPFTLGVDLAGVVEAVGEGVTSVAVGDAVYGYSNMMRQGSHAEYAVVSEIEIAPKPTTVDFVTAASVPLAGLTAWQGLFDVGGLQSGQTVLIHGAGGGIGSFAVQFARAKGARVLGTASSGKRDLLKGLGVAEVIDYTTTRFEEVVRDVDVVFDTVGGDLVERSLKVLKPGGIYVTSAGQPDPEAAAKQGVRATFMLTQPNPAELAEIARLIDSGEVKPVVSAVLPLAEARRAHELFAAGHAQGKIVLQVVE
jgi:NADPH:quinone reductase-like Zn-dependent oxidoreductase